MLTFLSPRPTSSLQNKSQIGKVDEILGPINEVYFTVKMDAGMVATSFKPDDKVYIGGDKLLPIERFLPKPKSLTKGQCSAIVHSAVLHGCSGCWITQLIILTSYTDLQRPQARKRRHQVVLAAAVVAVVVHAVASAVAVVAVAVALAAVGEEAAEVSGAHLGVDPAAFREAAGADVVHREAGAADAAVVATNCPSPIGGIAHLLCLFVRQSLSSITLASSLIRTRSLHICVSCLAGAT